MKPTYSIYTEILQTLTSYSKRIDTATATHTDFVDLQRLEAKIIDLYKDNYYKEPEYRVLSSIAHNLHNRMREVLLLNSQIRQIQKDCTA